MKKLIIMLSLVLMSSFSFSMSQEEQETTCEAVSAVLEEVVKLRFQGYNKWEVHQAFYQTGYSMYSGVIDLVYSDLVELSQGDLHKPQIKKYREKMKQTCLTGVNHFE